MSSKVYVQDGVTMIRTDDDGYDIDVVKLEHSNGNTYYMGEETVYDHNGDQIGWISARAAAICATDANGDQIGQLYSPGGGLPGVVTDSDIVDVILFIVKYCTEPAK